MRVIVLTGAGDKAFCAGADLTRGTKTFTLGLDEPMTDFGKLARFARESGIPMIARVNGDCVAGGMGLMSLCDLAVVADHAQVRFAGSARRRVPHAGVGLSAPHAARATYQRTVPDRRADRRNRAKEIGIANYVVPAADLDAKVMQLVTKLCEMSPVALRRGKYAIAAMESMSFAEALAFAETSIAVASRTDDAEEGLAAFNERRKPRWIADDPEWLTRSSGSAARRAPGATVPWRSRSCSAPTSSI